MKEHKRFWEKVAKCVWRRLGEKRKKELEAKEDLAREELVDILRHNIRCYYEQLKKMGAKRFKRLLKEEASALEETGEIVAKSHRKYFARFIEDPHEFVRIEKEATELYEALLDEQADSIDFEDTRLLKRLFWLSYLRDLRTQLLFSSLQPLLDISVLGNQILGLDVYWLTSLLALQLEEGMVKKKIREYGKKPKGRSYYKLVEQLTDLMKEKGKRPDQELFISPGYRRVRNNIVHDLQDWKATESDMHKVVSHVLAVAKSLWPDKFDSFETDEEDESA